MVLSQPTTQTAASNICPRQTSSMESAMMPRLRCLGSMGEELCQTQWKNAVLNKNVIPSKARNLHLGTRMCLHPQLQIPRFARDDRCLQVDRIYAIAARAESPELAATGGC